MNPLSDEGDLAGLTCLGYHEAGTDKAGMALHQARFNAIWISNIQVKQLDQFMESRVFMSFGLRASCRQRSVLRAS